MIGEVYLQLFDDNIAHKLNSLHLKQLHIDAVICLYFSVGRIEKLIKIGIGKIYALGWNKLDAQDSSLNIEHLKPNNIRTIKKNITLMIRKMSLLSIK